MTSLTYIHRGSKLHRQRVSSKSCQTMRRHHPSFYAPPPPNNDQPWIQKRRGYSFARVQLSPLTLDPRNCSDHR